MDDRANAEALRLAQAYLEKMGWKYTPKKIGETARQILNGMKEPTP